MFAVVVWWLFHYDFIWCLRVFCDCALWVLFWVCSLLFGEFSWWWFGLLVAGGFAFAFDGFGGCLRYCFGL